MFTIPSASGDEQRPNTAETEARAAEINEWYEAVEAENEAERPTPAPLSPQREAEIREREQAATKGPWRVDGDFAEIKTPDHDTIADYWEPTAESRNGEFIAHARTDVPALLAELNRVRAERDSFADRVDTLTAVAKGNKRHVQEMYLAVQKAQAEAAELKKRVATARTEAIADVGDWLDENGQKDAAYLVHTVDIPEYRNAKRTEGGA